MTESASDDRPHCPICGSCLVTVAEVAMGPNCRVCVHRLGSSVPGPLTAAEVLWRRDEADRMRYEEDWRRPAEDR